MNNEEALKEFIREDSDELKIRKPYFVYDSIPADVYTYIGEVLQQCAKDMAERLDRDIVQSIRQFQLDSDRRERFRP